MVPSAQPPQPAQWTGDPDHRGTTVRVDPLRWLRVGLGLVWGLNLLYIVLPANEFFPTYSDTAASFESTTLGGPGLPDFVAGHPALFAALTAGVTAYLAFAFLTGVTVRLACLVGASFNAVLLLTQFGPLVTFPGGTDIGPQPLYLLIYAVLFIGTLSSSRASSPSLSAAPDIVPGQAS